MLFECSRASEGPLASCVMGSSDFTVSHAIVAPSAVRLYFTPLKPTMHLEHPLLPTTSTFPDLVSNFDFLITSTLSCNAHCTPVHLGHCKATTASMRIKFNARGMNRAGCRGDYSHSPHLRKVEVTSAECLPGLDLRVSQAQTSLLSLQLS